MACIYLLNSCGVPQSFDFDITYLYPYIVNPYLYLYFVCWKICTYSAFNQGRVNWSPLSHNLWLINRDIPHRNFEMLSCLNNLKLCGLFLLSDNLTKKITMLKNVHTTPNCLGVRVLQNCQYHVCQYFIRNGFFKYLLGLFYKVTDTMCIMSHITCHMFCVTFCMFFCWLNKLVEGLWDRPTPASFICIPLFFWKLFLFKNHH